MDNNGIKWHIELLRGLDELIYVKLLKQCLNIVNLAIITNYS